MEPFDINALIQNYAGQIPAVMVVWFFMIKPHLQRVENVLRDIAVSNKAVEATLGEMKERLSHVDSRVGDLEEWRQDVTPLIGHKTRSPDDGPV